MQQRLATIGTWASSFGGRLGLIVSNNDGMGMSMFNAWSKDNKGPDSGYDANSDAVAAIAEGYSGTLGQHADIRPISRCGCSATPRWRRHPTPASPAENDAGNVLAEDAPTSTSRLTAPTMR